MLTFCLDEKCCVVKRNITFLLFQFSCCREFCYCSSIIVSKICFNNSGLFQWPPLWVMPRKGERGRVTQRKQIPNCFSSPFDSHLIFCVSSHPRFSQNSSRYFKTSVFFCWFINIGYPFSRIETKSRNFSNSPCSFHVFSLNFIMISIKLSPHTLIKTCFFLICSSFTNYVILIISCDPL